MYEQERTKEDSADNIAKKSNRVSDKNPQNLSKVGPDGNQPHQLQEIADNYTDSKFLIQNKDEVLARKNQQFTSNAKQSDNLDAAPLQLIRTGGETMNNSTSTIQRMTATPASVTVFTARNRVTKVVNDDSGQAIEFVMLDSLPATIPEGTAVISPLRRNSAVVRFANEETASAGAPGLGKIKKVTVEDDADAAPPQAAAAAASSGGGARAASSGGRRPTPSPSGEEVEISNSGAQTLFPRGMGLTSFEKERRGPEVIDKGQEHFEKHGNEFDAASKAEYIRSAKTLGREASNKFVEVKIKNTMIRFDTETHQMVISSGRQIRTHYIWDRKYSNPVAYAIYYTLTNNMKIPLERLDPNVLRKLHAAGYDLESTEREYLLTGLLDGKSPEQLLSETGASQQNMEIALDKYKMIVALSGGKRAPQGFEMPELTAEELAELSDDDTDEEEPAIAAAAGAAPSASAEVIPVKKG